MKTRVTQSKTGKSMLVTFYEGFSTNTIALLMSYGIRFFAEGLLDSLETLFERPEVRNELSGKDGEKAHIQEIIIKAS